MSRLLLRFLIEKDKNFGMLFHYLLDKEQNFVRYDVKYVKYADDERQFWESP